MIRSEWGYECVFSNYRSTARGMAIIFNNDFEHKVLKEKQDTEGNIYVP